MCNNPPPPPLTPKICCLSRVSASEHACMRDEYLLVAYDLGYGLMLELQRLSEN